MSRERFTWFWFKCSFLGVRIIRRQGEILKLSAVFSQGNYICISFGMSIAGTYVCHLGIVYAGELCSTWNWRQMTGKRREHYPPFKLAPRGKLTIHRFKGTKPAQCPPVRSTCVWQFIHSFHSMPSRKLVAKGSGIILTVKLTLQTPFPSSMF